MKNKIKVERAKRRITQDELAKAVGSNQPTINRIETGKSGLKLCVAMKIAKYFDKNIEDIFEL